MLPRSSGGAPCRPHGWTVRSAGRSVGVFVTALALAGIVVACTENGSGPNQSSPSGAPAAHTTTTSTVAARPAKTVRVPADARTIQAAFDQSVPGDLVLVSPGVYNETVTISTENVVLRGLDRNTVILDGRFDLENGVVAQADGVAVENLTVRNYLVNGILFTKALLDDAADDASGGTEPAPAVAPYRSAYQTARAATNRATPEAPVQHQILTGYRASYITAYNNEQYGLYAFFAQNGQFDHSYASGHPDSGFYIGQCKPCNAVVTDVTAEANAIGYEGTNASGNLFVVNSTWRRNRIGMTPNSQNMERLAPQGDVVIAGNVVDDNNEPNSPAAAKGAFGLGIAVGGGNRNLITKNAVRGNRYVGILVSDLNEFLPEANRVEGNVATGNGIDLAYQIEATPGTAAPRTNCFAQNMFRTANPPGIESSLPCPGQPGAAPLEVRNATPPAAPPGADHRTLPAPPSQPSMPDAADAPASPAANLPMKVDVNAIAIPKA